MKRVLQIIHSEVADVSIVSKFFQKKHQSSIIFYKNLQYLKKKEINLFDLFIFHGGKQSANSKSKAILQEYNFLKYIIKKKQTYCRYMFRCSINCKNLWIQNI